MRRSEQRRRKNVALAAQVRERRQRERLLIDVIEEVADALVEVLLDDAFNVLEGAGTTARAWEQKAARSQAPLPVRLTLHLVEGAR